MSLDSSTIRIDRGSIVESDENGLDADDSTVIVRNSLIAISDADAAGISVFDSSLDVSYSTIGTRSANRVVT